MKKNNYNFEVVTQEAINKAYRAEFGASAASTHTYELGEGISESYTALHLPEGLTAILHDDIAQIVVKAGSMELITLAWNDSTVSILRNLGDMSAAEAFAAFAEQAVAS